MMKFRGLSKSYLLSKSFIETTGKISRYIMQISVKRGLKSEASRILKFQRLVVSYIVKLGSEDKRQRLVLLSSITTSIVLVILFLFGAISTNVFRGEVAYTQVDMAAGSIFVFVLTMIISLSLWPKVIDWLEIHKKN